MPETADFTDGRTVALMTHGNRVHGQVHASRQLAAADNAVVTLKLRTKGKSKSYWAVLIFQRHGTVLDAMYGESRKKPTKAKVAALRSLAQITGSRLAAS